jgi:hypothetical protein
MMGGRRPGKEHVMVTKHLWVSAVALLVVIAGIAPVALAEETIDTRTAFVEEFLGTSSTAVDVWRMVCPSGTARAEADVQDLSAGGPDGVLFTVILLKSGLGRAILRHAPDGGTSPLASLAQGSGVYFVHIHKNKATSAKVKYDSQQLCKDSAGKLLPNSAHNIGQNQ